MKKTYTKTGRSCRVTFQLPAEVGAAAAVLCGEFNEWDRSKHPMKLRKDGTLSATVSLAPGREYRYRFLVDGKRWENDWEADGYVGNVFGTEDSVVQV